jgi:hypothetical protein
MTTISFSQLDVKRIAPTNVADGYGDIATLKSARSQLQTDSRTFGPRTAPFVEPENRSSQEEIPIMLRSLSTNGISPDSPGGWCRPEAVRPEVSKGGAASAQANCGLQVESLDDLAAQEAGNA